MEQTLEQKVESLFADDEEDDKRPDTVAMASDGVAAASDKVEFASLHCVRCTELLGGVYSHHSST